MTFRSLPRVRALLAGIAAVAVGATGVGVAAPAFAAEELPELVITEIMPDNAGTPSDQDYFEFLEIANTTDAPIDVADHALQYNGASWIELVAPGGGDAGEAVIPAHGSAVLWLRYAVGSGEAAVEQWQLDDADFRAHYGDESSTYPLFYAVGQGGFANSGAREFRLFAPDRTTLVSGVDYDRTSNKGLSEQYTVPASGAVLADAVTGAPTPGTVDPAQLVRPEGGETPTDPTGPDPDRPTDPELRAPLLQITELAPDTANVDGADGYEFVEIFNASDAPIDFRDYALSYLYTDNALSAPVTLNATLWPATPADVVIPAGGTLVAWIVNPAGVAAGLTVDDFNAAFGTDLALGEDIVQLFTGGMANGGSRGIQIATATGHDVSRAYYFADDQTTASTAIQYGWNPGAGEHLWAPEAPDGTTQTMLALAAPTPGSVSAGQVPAAFVAAPAAGEAPIIADLTGGTDVPETADLDLGFTITDDVLVRSVTLELTDNLGAVQTRNLTVAAADRYDYSVPAADLFGKRWIEYTVTASDGMQRTSLGPVRVALVDGEPAPVRLNLTEGQFVAGSVRVAATGDGVRLEIDGTEVEGATPSLETGPVFAFEATNTDAFFRNGVKLGDEVLRIFDEGFYERIVTVDATVPVERVAPGEQVTLSVTAGTKAWPNADVNENNDDFAAQNLRLALPDGRVLLPEHCATTKEQDGQVTAPAFVECPDPSERIAFSDAALVSFLATFTIPEDAFTSVATQWDTTVVADGDHAITARAGADEVTTTVAVDNTAPAIAPTVNEGERYRGHLVVDAAATDDGAGVAEITATLDGVPIAVPLETSSLALAPGAHVAEFTATDAVGNAATTSVSFETADERPAIRLDGPTDGEIIEGDVAELTATPTSAEEDALDVSFRAGHGYAPGDEELTVSTGTVSDSQAVDRSGGDVLGADDLAALLGTDGVDVETTSTTGLPYQLYTIAVAQDVGTGALARVDWRGSANAGAKVILYVRTVDGAWEQVAEHLTTGEAETDFTLGTLVPVDGHVVDGQLTLLVQHSDGFSADNLSTRTSAVEPYHPDATPRGEYDFTIAIESDTQYYNETDDYYPHQLAIHEFLLDQRENLNLQYMIHNGDIVNVHTDPHQWDNANAAYTMLDEAQLPYGVLAGNHDVGGHAADYTEYSRHFGEARYAANPWYGGSYKDNRGHYDLVSAGGIDFLMVYMGWPTPNDEADNSEDIAWLNEVIQRYPERKVWINLHEYMLTTGGLGPFPQRVFDEVVTPNANVFAVSSGHYHDAYTRTDEIDDDGDGVADRTVYSMLFDYQGLPEGGQGYLRLAHFDNEGGRILVRTYSPSLDDFDSDEPSLNDPAGMQEFEIPYEAVGIVPASKTLAADSFRAEILTANEIGAQAGVASGAQATATWSDLTEGEHGWYVVATGPHGGTEYSEVRSFRTVPADGEEPGGPGDGEGGGEPGDGGGEPGDGDGGSGGEPGIEPHGTVTAAPGSALVPGGRMQVEFTGFQPGEEVRFVLHSTPTELDGVLTVAADGTLTGVLDIPEDVEAGTHQLEAIGASGLSVLSESFRISEASAGGSLPMTGSDPTVGIVAGAALLLLGGALALGIRRRRTT
ncbi:metallophosphoesterase [Microbacterium sp. CIAB417]|uniref:metallophosphoesterase n=1 Tax=Microbacterium sp. CIAB417 TaxID=2860287 RepID=UPI001FAB9033|nr:metallophosphoesterase [Microbacterium sp. CIAB417]